MGIAMLKISHDFSHESKIYSVFCEFRMWNMIIFIHRLLIHLVYNNKKYHLKSSYCLTFLTVSVSCMMQCPIIFHSSPLDKMAANLADDTLKYIFMKEKFYISIWISLKFVPRGPIDNRPAFVQLMAWCSTGDKPLPEPTLTQFTDAYMRH